MIRLWLVFAILALLIHLGITAWRKMEGKEKVNIIDFVDDFSTVGYKNYLMKHSEARIAIYRNENFDYKIFRVTL